ncbi:MAG TPA: DsbA family oxidoreductase [Streptosporangiaceae bacterium]|jgi:predicted DsbA family dithiol-disulfide isomerase
MRVDIWADIVCPWCYIGKREFELGLGEFAHRDSVGVVYRAFELDPSFPPATSTPVPELLSARYGLTAAQARDAERRVAARAATVGLVMDGSRVMGNTFDAHRLVAFGRDRGRQAEVLQRLYEAYFGAGRGIFETADLAGLGAAVGLDRAEAERVLRGGGYDGEVRADEQQATELGISGVPFFVLDGRYGVSGAQPAAAFTAALDQAWGQRSR